MLSRVGLNRLTPRATPLLIFAANAPDLDVASALGGINHYLNWHRDFTHGIPMVPLMAALPVPAVALWKRPAGFPWLKAYAASLIGVASHLALDWTNIYGIRLLSPLSQQWFRLDTTGVIDPWIWCALALAVLWPMLARLVTSEIGAKAPAQYGSGMARFALAFLLFYNFGRWTLHERARAILDARIYDGAVPRQTLAMPHFANPFRWRGLVELEGRWREYPIDLASSADFDPGAGAVYIQAEPSPVLDAARKLPSFQALGRFSPTLLWRATRLPDEKAGWTVTAADLRFGNPSEEMFTSTARVGVDGRASDEGFNFSTARSPGIPR
jgi:inner membrane protein